MEFNLKTLMPTYHLTLGLPGRSNALLIAERIGLMPEIIELARSTLDPSGLKADDLLDEINHQRTQARRARGDADRARFEAEKMRQELAQRLEKLEEERLDILEQTRSTAQERIEALESELNDARRVLQRAHQPLDEIEPALEQVENLKAEVEKPVSRRRQPRTDKSTPRQMKVGQKVRVRSLKTEAVITSLNGDDVEVQIGALRMRTTRADIQSSAVELPAPAAAPAPPAKSPEESRPARQVFSAASPGMELDLRGQRAEDALLALERYLEQAYSAGMLYVRIIHGKGTGKLRQVVREALTHSPQVSRWENGMDNEGGEGVTVAHLAK